MTSTITAQSVGRGRHRFGRAGLVPVDHSSRLSTADCSCPGGIPASIARTLRRAGPTALHRRLLRSEPAKASLPRRWKSTAGRSAAARANRHRPGVIHPFLMTLVSA